MRVAPEIVLSEEEHAELTKLVRSKRTSVRLAQRAQVVLLAAEGMQNKEIAQRLNTGRVQVGRWRKRYAESRLAGIERNLPRVRSRLIVNRFFEQIGSFSVPVFEGVHRGDVS